MPKQCPSCGGFGGNGHICPNVVSIDKHKARACKCGSVSYALLKSGDIECNHCHRQFGKWSEK